MSRNKQQGMAVIELALVTTTLLLLILVTSEFGRLFYQYNELTKSLRPAARYMSENALSGAGAFIISDTDTTIAKNLVVYNSPQNTGNPRFSNLSVDDVTINGDGIHVVVSVNWTYQSLFGGSIPTFQLADEDINSGELALRASLAMRVLN